MTPKNISQTQYTLLQEAFDHYNETLFDGSLPAAVITIDSRSGKFHGLYQTEKMESTDNKDEKLSVITLQADTMNRDPEIVLSTFVHEMAHHWQYAFGTPSRNGYHNKEWADKMESIGLTPSNTGEPGGKRTGSQMTHYITPGGKFEQATADFLTKEKTAILFAGIKRPTGKASQKSRNKIKYTCPTCSTNIWGKPGLNVQCTDCAEAFTEQEQ